MNNKKYYLLSAFIFLAFAVLVFNHAFYLTLDSDGAFNAGVAKNWLLGYGYSSSWSTVQPFEAFISSGPGFTALQALGIALFGSGPDVQQPWIAFCHLSLWAMILLLLRRRFDDQQFFLFVLLSTLIFVCVQFRYWVRPAGELLSFLYLLLSFACIDRLDTGRYRYSVLAGLAAALGCLTKTQFAVFLPVLLLLYVVNLRLFSLSKFKAIVLTAIGFLIPVLCWGLYKYHGLSLLAQDDPAYVDFMSAKSAYFFYMRGSGFLSLLKMITGVEPVWSVLQKNILLNFDKLGGAFELFGAKKIVAAVLLVAAVIASVAVWRQQTAQWLRGLTVLLLAFWLWGFLITDYVFFNQLMIGIWLLLFFLCCYLVRWPKFSIFLASAIGVWLLVLGGILLPKQQGLCSVLRYGACVFSGDNPERTHRQQLLDYLQTHELDAPILTCGWLNAHELEFSLPGVANFAECSRFFVGKVTPDVTAFIEQAGLPTEFKQLSEKEILNKFVHRKINPLPIPTSMPVELTESLEFYFVVDPPFRGQSREQQIYIESWLQFCSTSVVRAGLYELKKCSHQDVLAYLNHWGGLPFPLITWEYDYYLRIQALFQQRQSLQELSMRPLPVH